MTNDEMNDLEAIANAATPGPWRQAGTKVRPHHVVASCHQSKGYQIHSMQHVAKDSPDVYRHMKHTYFRDAAFIAASREAVPALIEEVRQLRAACQEALGAGMMETQCSDILERALASAAPNKMEAGGDA